MDAQGNKAVITRMDDEELDTYGAEVGYRLLVSGVAEWVVWCNGPWCGHIRGRFAEKRDARSFAAIHDMEVHR